MQRGYAPLKPSEIAEAANVGRSTFYEHFRGKDDLLASTITPLLEPIARAAISDEPDPHLTSVLAHMWDNRGMARLLLNGGNRVLHLRLAELFEGHLTAQGTERRLAAASAVYLSDGAWALLSAWLTGRYAATPETLGYQLAATSHAAARALSRSRSAD